MPSPSEIVRLRQHRERHAYHNPAGWSGMGCGFLLVLCALVAGTTVTLLYASLTVGLPSVELLPVLLDPARGQLLQPTRIFDQSGEHLLLALENPAAPGQRKFLSLDSSQPNYLPGSLISATLTLSDPSFWRHPGATLEGLGHNAHPTLAQKLVSDLLLQAEPDGIRRALRERLVAAQITSRYGRKQVLTWYLNSANYGRLAYGAEAASHVYFGKPASQLSLAEAAILAATSEAPSLNPQDAPQAALERGQVAIQEMLASGMISNQQAQAALKEKVSIQSPVPSTYTDAPAFVDLVLEQLSQGIDLGRLERGGFRVISTLDYDLQIQTACALNVQLARLKSLPEPVNDQCQAALLLPTLPSGSLETLQGLGGSAVILNPSNARILALVGDVSLGTDPAHLPGHNAGSLLTPFIYLAGFTQGMGPASLVWDIPSGASTVQNPDGKYHGPIRLRTAMANDFLNPASQVFSQVGRDNVFHIASELGLQASEISTENGFSRFMVESKTTLLDISRAYGVFANRGTLAGWRSKGDQHSAGENLQAATILRLEDYDGKPQLEEPSPRTKPVISEQLSFIITNILSDEPARWPSLGHPNPLEIGRPAAAKLGYTENGTDAWAVGYTPTLVVGTWLGLTRKSSSVHVTPEMAAGLWHAIIQYASRGQPSQGWSAPQGVNTVSVCDPSGLLPTANCPSVVNEIFLSGNEPTQADSLFRKLQINRETGRLATVFTPPELVVEQVYMIVPPEAAEWARQAGLTTPPVSYDVILASQVPSAAVNITTPQMFSYVRGKVIIEGSASGDGFKSYRLQAGQGLNPQEWIQIGAETAAPVTQSQLGSWDTAGLSGLYAIQLLVVRQDQRIDTAVIQVTVDNQSPTVQVLYPTSGQEIEASNTSLVLRASASDDLALARVDFFIDGKQAGSVAQAPYSLAWQPIPGEHTLVVKATDQAGNTSQASAEFSVSIKP